MQNALKQTAQTQFAYSGPQGTVKPFMCEYLTNQQIASRQGGIQKGFSNSLLLAPHLQFHRGLSTFKGVSAPFSHF